MLLVSPRARWTLVRALPRVSAISARSKGVSPWGARRTIAGRRGGSEGTQSRQAKAGLESAAEWVARLRARSCWSEGVIAEKVAGWAVAVGGVWGGGRRGNQNAQRLTFNAERSIR